MNEHLPEPLLLAGFSVTFGGRMMLVRSARHFVEFLPQWFRGVYVSSGH
jgi:hypothetical protein